MKLCSTLLLALLLSAVLCACGAKPEPISAGVAPPSSSSSQESTSSESASSESESSEPTAQESSGASGSGAEADVEMQRVGSAEYGYVDIPATWIPFHDVEGGTDLQYTDGSGVNIITMNLFSDEGLTEEQKAQVTAETAAQSVWYNLEQNGDNAKIEGAQVEFCGMEAYQVYAGYADGSFLVTWSFEGEDGKLHYLAAEGTAADIFTTISYLENSWSLEE